MKKFEDFKLEPYAMTDEKSRGRLLDIPTTGDHRTEFQHDRDRIIHSKAFRRLESKTQVVVSNESDHNRKRLTHSLEVMQISDSMAYALGVNMSLTQAIALGHDIGHTPYGHGGQKALKKILEDHGLPGFKHNYQGLLVVNKLEDRYMDEGGLNLMYGTRDGILKHTSIDPKKFNIKDYDDKLDGNRLCPITIEGQIVRIVDEIAQRTHDTDDALRTGRIEIDELLDQGLIKMALEEKSDIAVNAIKEDIKANKGRTISKIIIAMIRFYVNDVITHTQETLLDKSIKDYDGVASDEDCLVNFSPEVESLDSPFQKPFLEDKFYRNYEIKRMDSRGEFFIKKLFKAFKKNPGQLPESTYNEFKKKSKHASCYEEGCVYKANNQYISEEGFLKCPIQTDFKSGKACDCIRVLVNHVAGMTDRHASKEYARLYLPPEI